jgi:hypothetical protein
MNNHLFRYGPTEINHLKKRDKKLGLAIDRIGMIERTVTPDPFAALAASIVAQQISAKAADTVWNRMQERFGTINPETLASASTEEIRQCGMSQKKAGYIQGIGTAVMQGDLDFSRFGELSDSEIIARLTALHGVGTCTGLRPSAGSSSIDIGNAIPRTVPLHRSISGRYRMSKPAILSTRILCSDHLQRRFPRVPAIT